MTDAPAYELFEELGRGQNTVVYRGYDLNLNRDVAIKQLNEASRKDVHRSQQFLKEASFLAQFEHENVLRIYTVDKPHGWIVMELMQGTLADKIRDQPMPADTVRSVLRQILGALDFLHQKNKVHGAVRPSNILINEQGTVKLSDFESTEAEGELIAPTGSKKHLAPELIRPEFGSFGPTVDLYCLGFTALELLTGPRFDSLFPGTGDGAIDADVAWLRWHSSDETLAPVQQLAPGIPEDLATMVDKLLSKNATDRPQTAQAVLEMLSEQNFIPVTVDASKTSPLVAAAIESGGPLKQSTFATKQSNLSKQSKRALASSVSTKDRVNEFLGRPYVLWPVCAAMLLAALSIGIVLRRSDETSATKKLAAVDPISPEGTIIEPQATDLIPAESAASTTADETTGSGEPVDTIAEGGEVEPSIGIDLEPHEMADNDSSIAVEPIEENPTVINPTVIDPTDGETELDDTLVGLFEGVNDDSADPEKTKALAEEFTGEAQLVIDSGGFIEEISDVAFSPDGRWIAASGAKVVRVWKTDSGELVATLRGDRSRTSYGNSNAVAFSPDGKRLLVGVNDYQAHGSIREYATDDFAEIKRLIPGHAAPCRKIAFADTGQRRISADADGNLLIVDTANGQTIGTIEAANPEQPIFDVIAFPSGRSDFILTVDFSGPKVYSGQGDPLGPNDDIPDDIRGWFMDVFGKRVLYPYGTKRDPRTIEFALQQGIWAAAGVGSENGSNKFWAAIFPSRPEATKAELVEPKTVYAGHRWSITALAMGPSVSGQPKLVASGDKFGEVHLWNLQTGKLLHKFRGQGKSIYEVRFDENSNRIAFGTTPFKPDEWNRNHFGAPEQVLDLRQRAILPLAAADDLELDNEQPTIAERAVDVFKPAGQGSFRVRLKRDGEPISNYRISSGRVPTVFTLLKESKLGVEQPVVFGDNEGMLALWDPSGDELRRAFIGHNAQVSGVSISRSGKLMVSGSADRTIRIWSLEDHQPTGVFDYKFENTTVIEVRQGTSSATAGVKAGDEIVTLDGLTVADIYNRMLEGTFDYQPGQVVPVEMKREGESYTYEMKLAEGYDFMEPTLNFFVGNDNQWIIWSPQGYYDASPGADQLIGWHVNRGPDKSAKFYNVGQFRDQLYRPDVIDRILDGASVVDAVRKANEERKTVAGDDFDFRDPSEIAEFHPPVIEVLVPSGPTQTRDERLTVAVRVESPNGRTIREVTLLRNGNVLKVFRPESGNGPVFAIQHEVSLIPGQNHLEFIASNGQASSAPVGIQVERIANVTTEVVNAYVLAIGVSSYQDPQIGLNPIPMAAEDAAQFVDAVTQQQNGKLYGRIEARVLADDNATRTNILDGFQWLVDRAQPNDAVIVFFAGHAFVDSQDNFYLATHEVETDRPRATAVSWREFVGMLHEDLPPCKRIVFLDARPTDAGIRPGMRNPLLDLAIPELGTTFFASSTLQQTSTALSESQHGAFLNAIVETMRDRRSDRMPNPPDELLNPIELARGIRSRVIKDSAGRQSPTYFAAAPLRRENVLELRPTSSNTSE